MTESMNPEDLAQLIASIIRAEVGGSSTSTGYRDPRIGVADARDPLFAELREIVSPTHMLPGDLLEDARSVIAFFLPFESSVVDANAQHETKVAREWATAYVETNDLIERVGSRLIHALSEHGVRGFAEPPTHNFDPRSLTSRWSHKSVGVIAGLGSFGVHHMVITESGCAGRFGSLVIDRELPVTKRDRRERCIHFAQGGCLACVARCPVGALSEDGRLDKQLCRARCGTTAAEFAGLGGPKVCGKCACGPCALRPPE